MLGELSREQIELLLSEQVIGRIGCYAEGKIYVVPVTYMYDGMAVIGHTTKGKKIELLEKNPACCFEVEKVENMANWQSVIAWGTFEELHGQEAEIAMQKLIKKLMPLMVSQTSQPGHGLEIAHRQDTQGKKAIVYKINITEKTGRFEKR